VRVETPPTVDGDVLGDPAWAAATPLAAFWQTAPTEGAPASETTDVRILYTADTLYFGVVCHDSDPAGIVVNGSRRDSPLDETDAFQIALDTYRDRQNGFVFGTNPAGLEYDGQFTNEGQGGGASGGPGAAGRLAHRLQQELGRRLGREDEERRLRLERGVRDPVPHAALPGGRRRVGPEPAAQRAPPQRERVLGADPRQYDLFRVSRAGALVGLEPPPPRNLKLLPYALGEATRNAAAGAEDGRAPTPAATSSGASPRAWPSTPRSTPTSRRSRSTSSR